MPPFGFGASRNVPLLRGIRRIVPADARVSFLPRGGDAARRDFIQTGWIRWVAFVIAPRLVAAGPGARWAVARRPVSRRRRSAPAPGLAVRPRLARRTVTRGLLGLAIGLIALLPLGTGVLFLTRTPFRPGLAAFTGIAAAMVLLPPLVYVGVAPSLPVVLVLGALALGAGLRYGRRSIGRGPVALLALPVLAVPLVLLAARGAQKPVDQYDAFANWALKAKLLYFDRSFASASIAPPVHREYPLGLPALEAYFFDVIGSANTRVAHVLFVLFLAGLAIVAWNVLRPHVAALPLTVGLSVLLWMPAARDQALSAYADVPLACLFVSAVLLFGAERFALGSVFAAAALATKRDAVAFCAVLYGVTFVALLVRHERERLRALAISAFCVALSAVPWRVYDAVHDLHDRDVAPSLSRADQLPFVLGRIGHLVVERAYLWALPLATVAALVMLVRGRDRQLALGVLALGFGLVAALAIVYVSGTTGVRYLVRSTAERTLMTPALFAAAVLPLLVTRALEAAPEPARARGRRLLPWLRSPRDARRRR